MTPDQFDAASPEERNEAIALALGWSHREIGIGVLPDWQGDDGLAFKELWPEIIAMRDSAFITFACRQPYTPKEKIVDARGIFSGDTWAHAICKAFLALKKRT